MNSVRELTANKLYQAFTLSGSVMKEGDTESIVQHKHVNCKELAQRKVGAISNKMLEFHFFLVG